MVLESRLKFLVTSGMEQYLNQKKMRALIIVCLSVSEQSPSDQNAKLEEITRDVLENALVVDDHKVYTALYEYDRITNVRVSLKSA